jgi:uncharacterized protein DUF6484
MKVRDHMEEQPTATAETEIDPLLALVSGRATTTTGVAASTGGVVVGELIGMTDDGRTPLVVYPGQPGSGGVAARAILDLHGSHIGKQVLLVFEGADPAKPIVAGVLRDAQQSALEKRPGSVEVDVDGERMIVSAKQQLVLRCGQASITLTNAGKVLIEGAYVSSRSTGVNRIKGGSVQLN